MQIDPDFAFIVANKTNEVLKERWENDHAKAPTLTPETCPRLSVAEVESVMLALYHLGYFKPIDD